MTLIQTDQNTIRQITEASIEIECVSCETEVTAMENEAEILENENHELRKRYYGALLDNFKKDKEIETLENQINPTIQYTKFDELLPEITMQTLRSLQLTEANDSKFILAAICGFYADRLPDLKNINISGQYRKNEFKRPMTPKKKDLLKELLEERTKNSERSADRVSNLNKLIKTAIATINKKQN